MFFFLFDSFDDIYEAMETVLFFKGVVMNAKHLLFAKTLVNFIFVTLKIFVCYFFVFNGYSK